MREIVNTRSSLRNEGIRGDCSSDDLGANVCVSRYHLRTSVHSSCSEHDSDTPARWCLCSEHLSRRRSGFAGGQVFGEHASGPGRALDRRRVLKELAINSIITFSGVGDRIANDIAERAHEVYVDGEERRMASIEQLGTAEAWAGGSAQRASSVSEIETTRGSR